MTDRPPGPASSDERQSPPDNRQTAAEERQSLTEEQVRSVADALDRGEAERAVDLVEAMHAADAADLIDQIDTDQRNTLVDALGARFDAEVLAEVDEDLRDELVERLGSAAVATAVAELETDDAVELLGGLSEDVRTSVLDAVPSAERVQIEAGLSYPDESAGRLMQRKFIAVPEFWTVGQSIDYLRESENLPDDFYELFVVDPAQRPVGTMPLNRFLRTKRDVLVGDIMGREPRLIPVLMDQEDVAFQFQQYDLASAGVVDEGGRLVGVIMIDDIVDVIHEEAEEDLMRLAGVGDVGLARSVADTARNRFSWLFVNLLTAILASLVIFFFEGTIQQIVAVAVLMPIVASMGGNAGTQTLTVAVRAMATHELTASNAARVVTKELLVGVANGLLFALLVALLGGLWYGMPELGAVFGLATLITLVAAALAGILVPLGLDRMRIDPAVASTVFVTTVTDVVGFFSFLGLVAWLLL